MDLRLSPGLVQMVGSEEGLGVGQKRIETDGIVSKSRPAGCGLKYRTGTRNKAFKRTNVQSHSTAQDARRYQARICHVDGYCYHCSGARHGD